MSEIDPNEYAFLYFVTIILIIILIVVKPILSEETLNTERHLMYGESN